MGSVDRKIRDMIERVSKETAEKTIREEFRSYLGWEQAVPAPPTEPEQPLRCPWTIVPVKDVLKFTEIARMEKNGRKDKLPSNHGARWGLVEDHDLSEDFIEFCRRMGEKHGRTPNAISERIRTLFELGVRFTRS